MPQRRQGAADCLLSIEAELRRLDWWEQASPGTAALASRQPFCVDTLRFEQWLQWVFIPGMRQLLDSGQSLPQQCAITEMGEVAYAAQPEQAAALLRLLKAFDRLIADG